MIMARMCAWCAPHSFQGYKCDCGSENVTHIADDVYHCHGCNSNGRLSEAVTHGICPPCRAKAMPQRPPEWKRVEVQP